jgi:hypothetical protein
MQLELSAVATIHLVSWPVRGAACSWPQTLVHAARGHGSSVTLCGLSVGERARRGAASISSDVACKRCRRILESSQ